MAFEYTNKLFTCCPSLLGTDRLVKSTSEILRQLPPCASSELNDAFFLSDNWCFFFLWTPIACCRHFGLNYGFATFYLSRWRARWRIVPATAARGAGGTVHLYTLRLVNSRLYWVERIPRSGHVGGHRNPRRSGKTPRTTGSVKPVAVPLLSDLTTHLLGVK